MDISAHRASSGYSRGELVGRVLWGCVRPLFARSPRFCYGWRNALLRLFGARIGRGVRIYPSAEIFLPWQIQIENDVTIGWNVRFYSLGRITIGARTIVSQGAHLCAGTHDATRADFPLQRMPITIGSDVWIAAEAFIGPGVTVGAGSVVGARAVVVEDVPQWQMVAGNPARVIKPRVLATST